MATAKAYLPAQFHLDPSNPLATIIHQRHRQTDGTTDNGTDKLTTVSQRNIMKLALDRP